MPSDLTNMTDAFQWQIECTPAWLRRKQCLIYLYDIVIFSKDITKHVQPLTNVLQVWQQASLTINPASVILYQYLGHIVSDAGVQPDSSEAEQFHPTCPQECKETKTVSRIGKLLQLYESITAITTI